METIQKSTTKSTLTVSKIFKSNYQKEGTMSAELRQVVTTTSIYPSKRVSNSLEDNIFETDEFGFDEGQTYENEETRVAWIDVPENSTVESVMERLSKYPDACLYRIMDNQPIVSDSEDYAIHNDDLNVTLDTFANGQVVRFPKGHPTEGALALDTNGKVQYRKVAFSAKGKVDVDNRQASMDYGYISEEIKAEVNGAATVVDGQTI